MRGFLNMLSKKKEIIPLVAIMAFAATGSTSTGLYFLFNKSDVILNKTSNPEPWERIDPSNPQKFLVIDKSWKPSKDLQEVRRLTK